MTQLEQAWGLLADGGPVLMILAAMSVAMLALFLVKVYQFQRHGLFRRHGLDEGLAEWERSGDRALPERLLASRHPAARVVSAGMRDLTSGSGRTGPQVREEVTRLAQTQIALLSRHLRGLEVIAQTAPLLGLLGTILGMIKAFQVLEQAGSRADPALLAGGIWEALLTTAAGLAVAIPAAVAHHWLESLVDGTTRQIEDLATRLFTTPTRPAEREGPRAA